MSSKFPSSAGHYSLTKYSTDMNQDLRDDAKAKEFYENSTLLKRISHPDEQAGTVIFFLSDYASCSSFSFFFFEDPVL